MKFLLLLLPGGSLVLLTWVLWRARPSQDEDGMYVTQLRDWAKSEPVIPPADLPPVKPLAGRAVPRVDKVARFRTRYPERTA